MPFANTTLAVDEMISGITEAEIDKLMKKYQQQHDNESTTRFSMPP